MTMKVSLSEAVYQKCKAMMYSPALYNENYFYLAGVDDDLTIQDMAILDYASKDNLEYFKPLKQRGESRPYGCSSMKAFSPDTISKAAVELYQKNLVPMGIIRFFMYPGGRCYDIGDAYNTFQKSSPFFVLTFTLCSVSAAYAYYMHMLLYPLDSHAEQGYVNQQHISFEKFLHPEFLLTDMIDGSCLCQITN